MSSVLEGRDFIRGLLLADSLLVTGDGADIAGIGQRVYTDLAPAEPTYPMVIINLNAGAADNNYRLNLLDYRFQVVVIGTHMKQVSYLGERVYVALQDALPADQVGYVVWSCQMIQKIHLVFQDGARRFYRDGGIFRVRLNEMRS